ncbi:hypothetical protein GJ744_006686 [Endocarpon pusillum]|uniref:E3 ubiquitin-protein ligase PEP5 n=1 Tax=Endocarpon pusillum TaxID=364733 RepID=A0A8H7ALT5_9EURO|nr:hypothetical protein GJ744_006686 [Endocarpon pusillum]
MALTSWKSFAFFTVSQVPVPADDDGSYVFSNDITSLAAGSDSIFLGDSNGDVRILSRALRVVRLFHAADPSSHGSITHLKQIEATSLLVTICEDLSSDPVLKVWALDKEEKKTKGPKCLCTIGVQNGRRQFPVSAFVALEDLTQVAVGFANGAVTVIRGDLIHDRGTKQRIVFESEEPITALAIRESPMTILYIATTGRISNLVISGKGQGQPPRTVDSQGCGVGCMSVHKETGDIIIARDDAVYYYGPNGRGPSFAFDGPKKMITTFKDYVGLVCPPKVAQVSKSQTYRRLGGSEMGDLFSTSSFSLLETDLRYIAHTESLSTQVKEVFSEWGELFLLTIDGKLYRYQEKTLQEKLEILYQRNLYILAINLAQKAGVDTATQNVIFRKYGDYLYQKGDYDTAMQQYLRAIDNTEPSQVLRKFLDTQRIHNLIEYLEELHEHDKATADHTTLLLNCYAKLKDTEKLDAFIRAPGELKFDLETAISMCRQGGYFEQAAYLATKHGESSLVVDILVEDSKKYPEALAYIWQLEPLAAYPNLMKYSRVLLEHCPDETTQVFIDYYTGNYRPKEEVTATQEPQPQNQASAFQNLSALLPLPYMSRSAVASPAPEAQPQTTTADTKLASSAGTPAPEYPIPKPRTAFSSFIPHPSHFIRFLEALTSQPNISSTDKTDLYTTLFEMYLEAANSESTTSSEREAWQQKAKALITSQAQISTQLSDQPFSSIPTSSVLLLSSLSNFPTGTTLVRERANLYTDILRSHTTAKDTSGAISALRRYGPEDPSLYPIALSYFSSSTTVLSQPGVKEELQSVLRKIDQESLMAPLQVVKVLSQGGAVSMGMVKSYLSDNISRERKEIRNNRTLIESYRKESAAKKCELEDLGSKPIVFQARRCSACGGQLDLPTVHFACKHSFHQRCLNTGTVSQAAQADAMAEGRAECPVCKPQNDTIKAHRRAQVESADQHELFKAALERSQERFETVAEFFGRGVMNLNSIGNGPGAGGG